MDLRRLPRHAAYIGTNRYFITINVRERQRVFTNAQLVETCRGQVQSACKANGFQILTDCYMPDHLHLCLRGSTAVQTFANASRMRNSEPPTTPFGSESAGCGNRDITTASCDRMRISRSTSSTSSRTQFAPAWSLEPRTTDTHQRAFRGARPSGRAYPHSLLMAIIGSTRAARRAGT